MSVEQTPNPQNIGEQALHRTRGRAYLFASLAGLVAVAFYLYLFFQVLAWQLPAAAVGVLLALLILGSSYLAFRRGDERLLGNLAMAAAAVAYLGGELFFSGATTYNLLGGAILILLTGLVFKPGRLGSWLVVISAYFAGVFLFSSLEPLPRFDIQGLVLLQVFFPLMAAALVLGALWQGRRSFRLDTIRSRLVVAFLLVTLIPLALQAYLNNRNTQASLLESANRALFASASEVAGTVDTFMSSFRTSLASEATLPALVDFLSTPPEERGLLSQERADASATLRALSRKDLVRVLSYALLDPSGVDVLDTVSVNVGQDESDEEYFKRAYVDGLSYVSQIEFTSEAGQFHALVFSAPVVNISGEILGVLRVRYSAAILQEIVRASNGRAGEDSFGVLFAEIEGRLVHLAHGIAPETLYTTLLPFDDPNVLAELQAEGRMPMSTQFGEMSMDLPELHHALTDIDQQPFFVATDLATGDRLNQVAQVRLQEQPGWIMAFFQPQDAFLSVAQAQTNASLLLVIVLSVLAASAALGVSQWLSAPIVRLTQVARRVVAGDLQARAPIDSQDEIGELATTFNSMTTRLDETIAGLEETVAERTQDLERRANYLQAAAEVGRTAAEFTSLEELLDPITHLVSERFGYYHVGIFLLDENREYAELRASNSEGGWRMLSRGHKLKVGEEGIVGFVTGTAQPRIEQTVEGEEVVFYPNPELPATRSEMALPLLAAGRLLGALDIQSTEEQAFTEEDVTVLQLVADQVAIAINNALLFEQAQASMQAERRAYGQLTRKAWSELLQGPHVGGYRSTQDRVIRVDDAWHTVSEQALQTASTRESADGDQGHHLAVPIKVRDFVVGVMETHKPAAAGPWSQGEVALLEAIGEQLGVALENARLFEQTQRLANRERLTADVASRVWSSRDVESILQTAVQELGRALNASQGTIRLRVPGQQPEWEADE